MHFFLRSILATGIVLAAAPAYAQQAGKITISGYVRDGATGENLIGVAVVNPATGQGTATNTYGFYSLTLPEAPADSVRLLVSYLGYERSRWATPATRSATHDFRLRAVSSELGEVKVIGSQATEERIERTTRMGTINVPIAQIKSLPKLFGETDVLKVLQLLPGVQSGGEGQTGLYVRGGSPDQNLILLDGTPVYNASHLFGFFSVFNADALNNVELIKGGFPARYGGRLSSVLDISMKEGNMQELHGEGAIGIVASKITLEGPIKKDTASFIVSARRTYLDILAQPFIKAQLAADGSNGSIGYFFHDLNAKLNWKVSSRDRLYLSAYTGYDKFYARIRDGASRSRDYSRTEASLGWGNLTSALRWNRVVNNQLFMNTHFTYSKYQFNIGQEDEQRYTNNGQDRTDKYSLRYFSNIRDFSLKTDFDYVPSPDHYIRFGGQYTLHSFRPGALQQKDNFTEEDNQINLGTRTMASEASLYAEDDYRLTDRLKVNGGLRVNAFLVRGTLYPSVEPRVAARFLLTEDWALKAAYARTTQYIHLLTNSGIGLPTDLWVPATPTIKPQRAQQLSVGAARTVRFKDEDYELSFESYYKPMQNLIEYQEGASFLGTVDSDWENKVTSGKGWAYGGEFFLQKKTGRTTGWIGYTLAWSKRRFPDLNQGRIYPYKYDRRHDISVVAIHKFSPTLTLSGTWVYGTGNATTLSQGRFLLGPYQEFEDYGERNSYRMRAYHRFDLDLSKTKKKKWGEVVNSFSIYNVYSRRNPYYLYFQRGYSYNGVEEEKASYKQISLFPIIPSFSKAFRF
ncbi:TonB-dependent receptor [Hymenobacter psychrotolerans]|uniref:CarboxypepD_reg-like domain-containing protein n=1 Tax=Hymenobacter psychrotolerans DSM 18569 TaxID=1121959 RepID=A0A1M7GT90_9BACT|nr:TonB-dependent receptor [Hymenobacter psychrotolerans]SHM19395.1 CarboxypepD_reg-like domain-containing protein [Hymenobacter psychrotolerans DSM 18569]